MDIWRRYCEQNIKQKNEWITKGKSWKYPPAISHGKHGLSMDVCLPIALYVCLGHIMESHPSFSTSPPFHSAREHAFLSKRRNLLPERKKEREWVNIQSQPTFKENRIIFRGHCIHLPAALIFNQTMSRSKKTGPKLLWLMSRVTSGAVEFAKRLEGISPFMSLCDTFTKCRTG